MAQDTPKLNNETIGQSAEYALCKAAKIECNIDPKRINNIYVDKFYKLFLKENILEKLPKIKNSCGYKNGSVDFNLENGTTVSLKTLHHKSGKIPPQSVGQNTYRSWDKIWGTGWNGVLNKNPERWDFIKANIHSYLNEMLQGLFCCNYTIIIKSSIEKHPTIIFYNSELLKEPLNYFQTQPIIYTRENYEERWNEKEQRNSGFSSTIKLNMGGSIITIGEFQFHIHKSRKVLKFRFCCKFLQMVF